MWIALCAVESNPKQGDIYLDDGQDHALRIKFIGDYASEGILGMEPLRYKEIEALMDTQKVRDAEEELVKWQENNKNNTNRKEI